MSMNINIVASRKVQVLSTGELDTQTYRPRVWQTPTEVSYNIQTSTDPLQAYKDWVLSVSKDETVLIYAEEDLFCDGKPVGFRICNSGKDHIAELEDELEHLRSCGYVITTEVW